MMTNGFNIFATATAIKEWEIPSDSRVGVTYIVKMWLDRTNHIDGKLSCNCPAWLYQSKALDERSCKHTKKVELTLMGHPEIVEAAKNSLFRIKHVEDGRLQSFIASLQL